MAGSRRGISSGITWASYEYPDTSPRGSPLSPLEMISTNSPFTDRNRIGLMWPAFTTEMGCSGPEHAGRFLPGACSERAEAG